MASSGVSWVIAAKVGPCPALPCPACSVDAFVWVCLISARAGDREVGR